MSRYKGIDANSKRVAVPSYFCVEEGDTSLVEDEVEEDSTNDGNDE